MNLRKTALAALVTLGLSTVSAVSFAVATFYGTANAQVELTSGNPLVTFLPISNNLYVGGNFIAPGTYFASAGFTNAAASISGVPTLITNSSSNGNADANGTGYADATGQSMAFASFSLVNNTGAKLNYKLHFKGQATAGGSATSAADWFYVDSAFVLNKNSVPTFGGNWVWGQSGPATQALDTGLVEFDVNDSLFAGQSVTWSIQTTVNGYVQSNPVPEPSSMALLAMGGMALVSRFRRK